MHDFTLRTIDLSWPERAGVIVVRGPAGEQRIHIRGLRDFHAPCAEPWGPSASINGTDGPTQIGPGVQRLTIEMQSGDVIVIDAEAISLGHD